MKKYVSECLIDATKLTKYILLGKITPLEYHNYFSNITLPAEAIGVVYRGIDFVNYVLANKDNYKLCGEGISEIAKDKQKLKAIALNKVSTGEISATTYTKELFWLNAPIKSYVYEAFSNLDDFHEGFKEFNLGGEVFTKNTLQLLYKYLIEMLKLGKITLEDYKKTILKYSYPKMPVERKLNKKFQDAIISPTFKLGDISGITLTGHERALITIEDVYLNKELFPPLTEEFHWRKISENPYLPKEFILANLSHIYLQQLLAFNKIIDIDFFKENISSFRELGLSVSLESMYLDHFYKWKFEDIIELLNLGILYIEDPIPPVELAQIYGEKVYEFGYMREVTIQIPYIKGLSSEDYTKIMMESLKDKKLI